VKTKTKILAAILAVVVVAAAGAAAFTLVSTPYSPQPPNVLPQGDQPQAQLQVTGSVLQEETYSFRQLTEMPLTNVTATINGENATYLGVDFFNFCNQTGMNWDAGPIDIISADGSKATLNIHQAYNSTFYPYYYNNNVIVLAFAKNGEWLTNTTGGPLKLVAPYFSGEYQVQDVAEIHFKPWMITITGKVANPLTLNSANLSSIPSRTVYAEFAPSEKRWSNWTGLPIVDVLQAANVSEIAEKVKVTAVDGYVQNFTLQQIRDGQMMIGFQENGSPLPHSEGGPYRLFAPTDKYKWAQFWVKYIVNIEVL